MRILVVGATAAEVQDLTHPRHEIQTLITGVGMVATAAACSLALARRQFDLALNVGLCGSFDRALAPGTVVHVISDRIAELGAEDGDAFLTLQDLRLTGQSEFVNAAPPANPALQALPSVAGITVNTVHGNARSIAAVVRRFNPQVESMEGAAFMCACLMHAVPFAQVRAVSNAVEPRDREAWRIPEALASLAVTTLKILEHA